MPYSCTTVTATDIDTVVADYQTFRAEETLITCVMDGRLRLPSDAKVRYFCADPDGIGAFVVAIRDDFGALVSLALCEQKTATQVFLAHWVLVDSRQDFTAIGIAGGEHLRAMGYAECVGIATGEMGARITQVPAVTDEPATSWLTLDLSAL